MARRFTSEQLRQHKTLQKLINAAPAKNPVQRKAKVVVQEAPTVSRAVISIDKLLPGLNGNDGLIRQSHFKATKVKAALLEDVKSGNHGTFGRARVKIICTRYYCGTAMDFDNASASFKYLVDSIVKAGIIYDDGPKTIEEWTVKQVSVKSRKFQKMEVEILIHL